MEAQKSVRDRGEQVLSQQPIPPHYKADVGVELADSSLRLAPGSGRNKRDLVFVSKIHELPMGGSCVLAVVKSNDSDQRSRRKPVHRSQAFQTRVFTAKKKDFQSPLCKCEE